MTIDTPIGPAASTRRRLGRRKVGGRGLSEWFLRLTGRVSLTSLAEDDRDSHRFRFDAEPHDSTRIGVCLSGGGIRSAAFCLGALQRAQQVGFLSDVRYLSAVSGGGYIAAARAMTATHSDEESLAQLETWAPGSPEAQFLRANSDYLAPGLTGRLWFLLNTLWGFALNLAPLLAASLTIGGATALALRPRQPGLQTVGTVGSLTVSPVVIWLALLPILAAILLVGVWRRSESDHKLPMLARLRLSSLRIEALARLAVLASLAIAGAALAVPCAVWLARLVLSMAHALINWRSYPWGSPSSAVLPTGVEAAYLSTAVYITILATSLLAVALARRSKAFKTMLALAGFSGPLLLLIPGISFAHHVFADVPTRKEYIGLAIALVACLLFAVFAHNGRYSMHLYYRDRLAHVFAVRRNGSEQPAPACPDEPLWLSRIAAPEGEPELILCTALNVSDRVVPRGRQSASFVFTKERSGSRLFGDYFRTAELEKSAGLGSPPLTLPSIVAISGAALSPVMGRLTIKPLRFVLAVLNLRLGVWIPNPSPDWAAVRATREQARLDADARRLEQRGIATTATEQADEPGTEQADELQAEQAAEPGTVGAKRPRYPNASPGRRLLRHVIDGWREPGALYVWREATGSMRLDREFIYITDGGHFDNLGLVELVRRRCSRIVCFDASLDPRDGFEPLRTAIALCRSDLGVEIDIDPRPLVRNEDGVAETDTVVGTVRYRDQPPGKLVYSRATISDETPAALQLHAKDNAFPDHSTGDQFFTDDEFEAFRALGHSTAWRSLTRIEVPGFRLD